MTLIPSSHSGDHAPGRRMGAWPVRRHTEALQAAPRARLCAVEYFVRDPYQCMHFLFISSTQANRQTIHEHGDKECGWRDRRLVQVLGRWMLMSRRW